MPGLTAVVNPLMVRADVEFTELTFVTPVAFVRLTVTGFVCAVILTVSMLVMVAGVTDPISVAVKVSLPAPPAKASLDCHV